MHAQHGPFLSAAAIRRILDMHSFSEANRAYLLAEAERRAAWEREVEALLLGVTVAAEPAPADETSPSSPSLAAADGAEVLPRNLEPAPPR